MTVCISESVYGDKGVIVGSKDERFQKAWGWKNRVSRENLFDVMNEIASWVNNELKEECLFEML